MFEYIKRVSVAISFMAQKIDHNQKSIKDILSSTSLDLLLLAQNFRFDNYKIEDLKNLQNQVSYLIDILDFARINNFVSPMNAKIFTDSQLTFLKHISNLIDQKNSATLPYFNLKELDENIARKSAKENLQSKFSFTELPIVEQKYFAESQKEKENLDADFVTPKKILEESLIIPKSDFTQGSLESLEQEREGRRARILKCLLSGGGSIKEISAKLKDINEKTLQRDLLELMRDKKVIMLGKKRWSKYYLK